jgi:hypothetical protein
MDIISIITLPFILLSQNFFNFYKELNANLLLYLIVLTKLLWRKFRSDRKRFDLYDPFCDKDIKKLGLRASEEEWILDKPRIESNENLFIYGINSNGQTFVLMIKNRNLKNDSRIMSSVKCLFRDSDNITYSMEETVLNDRNIDHYSSCGITVEVLNPMRRLRIKISSFMKKINNNSELVFIRARFIWYAFSNVFDYQSDYDLYFMAKQIAKQSKSWKIIPQTENCFEQFGQLKGTIQVEQNRQKDVFLWGIRNKKFIENLDETKVWKIHGYSPNKGIGFNIRIFENMETNER